MNKTNLRRLIVRAEKVGLNMKNCATYSVDITGVNCCLLEHAAYLALQDGYSHPLTRELAGRWLGMGYGELCQCGWFARENGPETILEKLKKVIDAPTKHMHVGSRLAGSTR